jgi:hypothetical protein
MPTARYGEAPQAFIEPWLGVSQVSKARPM